MTFQHEATEDTETHGGWRPRTGLLAARRLRPATGGGAIRQMQATEIATRLHLPDRVSSCRAARGTATSPKAAASFSVFAA